MVQGGLKAGERERGSARKGEQPAHSQEAGLRRRVKRGRASDAGQPRRRGRLEGGRRVDWGGVAHESGKGSLPLALPGTRHRPRLKRTSRLGPIAPPQGCAIPRFSRSSCVARARLAQASRRPLRAAVELSSSGFASCVFGTCVCSCEASYRHLFDQSLRVATCPLSLREGGLLLAHSSPPPPSPPPLLPATSSRWSTLRALRVCWLDTGSSVHSGSGSPRMGRPRARRLVAALCPPPARFTALALRVPHLR